MEALFLKIFNISVTATWLALAVFVVRLILKKAPKWLSVMMWALVGVRLICPFSVESVISLIPSTQTLPPDIAYTDTPTINSGIPFLNSSVNPIVSESFSPTVGDSANPLQIVLYIAGVVWLVGMAVMLAYAIVSYALVRRRVREAVPLNENVYLCDRIEAPFILGVFRPRVYMPSTVSETDARYVIAHEKAHIKRFDHVWKPLGFILLAVHWFNPVMWLAYVCLCRDIELACDERVIKEQGLDIKKKYSEALINCSVPRKLISACPLAFGEIAVKSRIKSVLSYKKPAFWIIVLAVLTCIALAALFLTDPKTDEKDESEDQTQEISNDLSEEISKDESTEQSLEIIEDSEEIAELKKRYPQYFELDTTNGLTVYVWQMAANHYSCTLTEGTPYTQEYQDILGSKSCTISTMRSIAQYYAENGIATPIYVQPITNPISSYGYQITPTYTHSLLNRFWFSWYGEDYGYFDNAIFDIDGDGEDEMCTITTNPFTGMRRDYFVVYKNGTIYSMTTFMGGAGVEFAKRADGTYCVETRLENSTTPHYLDIVFENGKVKFVSDRLVISSDISNLE